MPRWFAHVLTQERVRARLAIPGLVALPLAGLLVVACGGDASRPENGRRQTEADRVASTVHARLEGIGRLCAERRSAGRRAALEEAADVLIGLARRYPTLRFRIHDESASMTSALLVVRQRLLSCEPGLARRVEGELPRGIREGLRSERRLPDRLP